jgi:N-acetylglutamate synthase-like GNAT family acetyltransferase
MEMEYLDAQSIDEREIRVILHSLNGDSSEFDLNKFTVAKDNNKVIGCIRIKSLNNILELSSLAVLPEYQNKGIGSESIKKLLDKELARPIFLITSSDKEYFYNKFGFVLVNLKYLPNELKDEYSRTANLPFAKSIKIIAMKCVA